MEGPTTLLSSSTHTHFPIASKDFSIASKDAFPASKDLPYHMGPPRKRKPIVTYQSPGSGLVDVDLLVRNTTLEFEAAAVAAASRAVPPSPTPTPALTAPCPPSPPTVVDAVVPDTSLASVKIETTFRITAVHRPATTPRPPRPLYHPLSRPNTTRSSIKNGTTATSSMTSQLAPPTIETGRRSSSRTRRPAPKIRDTEALVSASKVVQDKPSPVKRRRAGGAKRKRAGAQLDVDGDGTYPSAKRTRKPREKVEVEVDSETMPPPAASGSPTGYSTRAKRPRKVGSGHVRAESSTSDGTGSVTRTTPINGHVEDFLVPTKAG